MNILLVMVSFVAFLALFFEMPAEYQQGYKVNIKYAKKTGFASDVLFAHGTIADYLSPNIQT